MPKLLTVFGYRDMYIVHTHVRIHHNDYENVTFTNHVQNSMLTHHFTKSLRILNETSSFPVGWNFETNSECTCGLRLPSLDLFAMLGLVTLRDDYERSYKKKAILLSKALKFPIIFSLSKTCGLASSREEPPPPFVWMVSCSSFVSLSQEGSASEDSYEPIIFR